MKQVLDKGFAIGAMIKYMPETLLTEFDTARGQIMFERRRRESLENAENAVQMLHAIGGCRQEWLDQIAAMLTLGTTIGDLRTKLLPIFKENEESVIRIHALAALEECEILIQNLNDLLVSLKRATSLDDLQEARARLDDVYSVSFALWHQLHGYFENGTDSEALPEDWKEQIATEARKIIGVLHVEMEMYRSAAGSS